MTCGGLDRVSFFVNNLEPLLVPAASGALFPVSKGLELFGVEGCRWF